jgi:cytochrome d ubiquinol oxidase subunit II
MLELWFFLASMMLTAWAVLDGFSLGSGVVSGLFAKTDREKRTVLAAIGPSWDGSEVCLIASGGVLLLAFPKTMTAGFSGFYLPLFFFVWSLLGRGLSIELRSHITSELWRSFWDFVFAVSSALLLFLAGVLMGNILRGVPLTKEAYFSLPLFGDLTTTGTLGVLDWYTVLIGLFVLVASTTHGALFLLWKTEDSLHKAVSAAIKKLCLASVVLWSVVLLATSQVTSQLASFAERAWAWPAALLFVGGSFLVWRGLSQKQERLAFLGSCAALVGLMLCTALSAFPTMLRASTDASLSLTVYNNDTDQAGISTALHWWIPAFLIACGYFIYIFRTFRGKAEAAKDGEGY